MGIVEYNMRWSREVSVVHISFFYCVYKINVDNQSSWRWKPTFLTFLCISVTIT